MPERFYFAQLPYMSPESRLVIGKAGLVPGEDTARSIGYPGANSAGSRQLAQDLLGRLHVVDVAEIIL